MTYLLYHPCIPEKMFQRENHSRQGDIIGYSDSEEENDEDSELEASIDVTDINPNLKFLPATVDGLVESSV